MYFSVIAAEAVSNWSPSIDFSRLQTLGTNIQGYQAKPSRNPTPCPLSMRKEKLIYVGIARWVIYTACHLADQSLT